MTLETDFRRDTNPTPTRFIFECGQFTPTLGLNFDPPFNPFENSYNKLLNASTPKTDSDPFADYNSKAFPDTLMELATSQQHHHHHHQHLQLQQQQQNLPSELHHPWSDMVSDEACIPMRQMSVDMSSASSTYSSSSPSTSTPPLSASSTRFLVHAKATSSMTSGSDHVPFSCSDGGHPPRAYSHHTHEEPQPPFHTFTVDSTQKYHSDQELPSLAPDSPTPDSLVPSDTVVQPGFDMTTFNQTATLYQTYNDNNSDGDNSPGMFDSDNNDNSEHDQDMSDHHDSGMDVDSNESQDEDDISTQGRSESRDPPSRLKKNTRASRSRASAAIKGSKVQKTTTTAAPSKTKKSSGVANTRKSSGSTKSKTNTPPYSRLNSGKGVARLSRKHSSPSSSASPSSSPEETPEVKRQRFLERNRMAAAKCREKKRQQTLKTIADADAITSRNQALHETLEDLQEEVRTLKNQILCHRDCGCDVIQKFVKTSLGSLTGSTSSLMMSSRPERF